MTNWLRMDAMLMMEPDWLFFFMKAMVAWERK